MGFSIIDNNLDKVITNTKTNSLKKLNLRNRPLTASEILLAQSIYKNTIFLDSPQIECFGYWKYLKNLFYESKYNTWYNDL